MLIILSITACRGQIENDPYWEFNEEQRFRPRLKNGDFFKLNDDDLNWLIIEELSKYVGRLEHEIERARYFSFGQKALYFWAPLDAQVNNGGFVQFFDNGYGKYAPTIIKGFNYIGNRKAADLVRRATLLYQEYERISENEAAVEIVFQNLDLLDTEYYNMADSISSGFASYIRENPNQTCIDEDGEEFDLDYIGPYKSYYDNDIIKENFYINKGKIKGSYKSYYQNENPKETILFKRGKQTGEREEYYENGVLLYQAKLDTINDLLTHNSFYKYGNPKEVESTYKDQTKRIGEYKKWHENGNLINVRNYNTNGDPNGEWLYFYNNGDRKSEAEYRNGTYLLKNYWAEDGEQTLINGSGTVDDTDSLGYVTFRRENKYTDYKRHGKQKTYTNGVLSMYQETVNGINHGTTREYYNNGNIESESVYENGKIISKDVYRKYNNPKVNTTITSRLCERCYKDQEEFILPDNEPHMENNIVLEQDFHGVETSIFDGSNDDIILSYSFRVYVDKNGNVEELEFYSASNIFAEKQVKENLKKLKFSPAVNNSIPIKSIHFVICEFKLSE